MIKSNSSTSVKTKNDDPIRNCYSTTPIILLLWEGRQKEKGKGKGKGKRKVSVLSTNDTGNAAQLRGGIGTDFASLSEHRSETQEVTGVCFSDPNRIEDAGSDASNLPSSISQLCFGVEEERERDDYTLFIHGLVQPLSRLRRSRGCFGCCTKPSPIIAVDEPSKGLRIQGQMVKKPSASEDFWSTSTYDLENSAVQSQRSISSISMSNQSLNQSATSSNHSEFVNHGLLLWNQTRLQWIGNKRSDHHGQVHKPRLSWNVSYESLLGTNKQFSRPVPLSEMVEFLSDNWEQEGLYD